MKKIYTMGLIVCLSSLALFGCRDRDESPKVPADIALSASKNMALADGSDAVTIKAYVGTSVFPVIYASDINGDVVADGTAVTFAVNDNEQISTSTAYTTNGIASIILTHAPVSGANNLIVKVTATAGAVSDVWGVKFINQPSSVDVYIAFDRADANLAVLRFSLKNTSGAIFDDTTQPISAINAAAGSTVTGHFDAAANSTAISLSNPNGFRSFTPPIIETAYLNGAKHLVAYRAASESGPPAPLPSPVIKMTFAVAAGAGMPSFSIDKLAPFTAADINGNAVLYPVITDMVVVQVTYDTEL